jgi:hypothetical protein
MDKAEDKGVAENVASVHPAKWYVKIDIISEQHDCRNSICARAAEMRRPACRFQAIGILGP